MKRFKEIYEEMQSTPLFDERFTILKLLKIFEEESSWCGTNYQLIRIKEYSQEITGIRSGDCQGCMVQAVKNMIRFVNKYETDNPKEETQIVQTKNLYQNRKK